MHADGRRCSHPGQLCHQQFKRPLRLALQLSLGLAPLPRRRACRRRRSRTVDSSESLRRSCVHDPQTYAAGEWASGGERGEHGQGGLVRNRHTSTPHRGRPRSPRPPFPTIESVRTFRRSVSSSVMRMQRVASCTRLLLQTKTFMFSRTKIGGKPAVGVRRSCGAKTAVASGSTSMPNQIRTAEEGEPILGKQERVTTRTHSDLP